MRLVVPTRAFNNLLLPTTAARFQLNRSLLSRHHRSNTRSLPSISRRRRPQLRNMHHLSSSNNSSSIGNLQCRTREHLHPKRLKIGHMRATKNNLSSSHQYRKTSRLRSSLYKRRLSSSSESIMGETLCSVGYGGAGCRPRYAPKSFARHCGGAL